MHGSTGQPTVSDEQLIAEALDHPATFERIVARYYYMVFSVAFAHLRDPESSEELTQETFVRAFVHLDKLRCRCTLPAWLNRIARNEAIKWIRNRQTRSRLLPTIPLEAVPMDQADDRMPSARKLAEARSESSLIREALATLPAEDREIVVMHFLEDVGKSEIARRLNVHPSTVSRALIRGLEQMRNHSGIRELREIAPQPRQGIKSASAIILSVAALSAANKAALAAACAETGLLAATMTAAVPKTGLAALWSALSSAKAAVAVASLVVATGTLMHVHRSSASASQPKYAETVAANSTSTIGKAWSLPTRSTPRLSNPRSAGAHSTQTSDSAAARTSALAGDANSLAQPGHKNTKAAADSRGHGSTGTSRNPGAWPDATSTSLFSYYGTVTRQGSPALDATVEIISIDPEGAKPFGVVASAHCRVDGRYDVGTNEQNHLLRVGAPGSASVMAGPMVAGGKGGRFSIDVQLESGVSVSGKAIDGADLPVPGEPIIAVPSSLLSHLARDAGEPLISPAVLSTTSSADGTFVLTNATNEDYFLTTLSGKHVPSGPQVRAPAKHVVLKLDGGGASLNGSVIMTGSNATVAGVTVTLVPINPDNSYRAALAAFELAPRGNSMHEPLSCITDGAGNFRLEHIPGDTYRLWGSKDRARLRVLGGPPTLTLAPNETSSGVTLTLFGGHTIRGTVSDHDSGNPIAGVELTIPTDDDRDKRSVYTDASGRYRIEGVFDQLMPVKKGFRIYSPDGNNDEQLLSLSPDELEVEKNYSLVAATHVTGRVCRKNGHPVAGVSVTRHAFDDRSPGSNSGLLTDEKGLYEFEVRPHCAGGIEAKLDGFPPAFVDGIQVEDKPVTAPDIILQPGGSISGTVVTPDGAPASEASVSIARFVSIRNGVYTNVPVASGTSRADGTFSVVNVPEGILSIEAKRKGYARSAPVDLHFTAGGSESGVTLKLEHGHFIAGKVARPDGKPVASAIVDGGSSAYSTWARTDKDGNYRLEDLPADVYTVSVNSEPGGAHKEDVRVDSNDVDFVLNGNLSTDPSCTGSLVGTVVDWKTKEGLKDFQVEIRGLHTDTTITRDPVMSGRFTVNRLDANCSFRLHITAPGYTDLDSQPCLASDSTSQPIDFAMGPGGTISGRAVESGKPAANVKVFLYGVTDLVAIADRMPIKTVTTGADGTFCFEQASAGEALVVSRPPAPFGPITRTAKVIHGAVTDLGDLELAGGTISGKVVRGSGDKPAADIQVAVTGDQTPGYAANCVTAADGTFGVEHLPAGAYSVKTVGVDDAGTNIDLKESESRELVLRIGRGVLKGTITKGGKAAIGAYVSLRQSGNAASKGQTVNGDGSFRIEGLASGTWKVSLGSRVCESRSGPNERILECSIDVGTVEIDETEIEKSYTIPNASVSGKVVDALGKPLSAASVKLGCGTARDYWAYEATTASDGAFVFDSLSEGDYQLTANCGENGCGLARVTVAKDTPLKDVVLKLEKGNTGTLVSTVLDMGGQAIPRAWCYLDGKDGRFEHNAARDSKGVMTIQNIPAGTYEVEVSCWSFSVTKAAIEIKAGETARLDAVLYPAGVMGWKFTTSAGAPLAGVKCTLTPDAPDSIEKSRSGISNEAGSWSLRGLAAGPYTGTATTPSGKVLTEKITITTGQTAAVTSKE